MGAGIVMSTEFTKCQKLDDDTSFNCLDYLGTTLMPISMPMPINADTYKMKKADVPLPLPLQLQLQMQMHMSNNKDDIDNCYECADIDPKKIYAITRNKCRIRKY